MKNFLENGVVRSLHKVRVTLLTPLKSPLVQGGTPFSSNVAPQRGMKNSYIVLVVVLVLEKKPRTTTRTRVLIFGSAPPHFSLRSQCAVFPVCKKNLGDVEVLVDLLQAGPDAIEVFFRSRFPGGAALQGKTHAFPEKHHDKDGE